MFKPDSVLNRHFFGDGHIFKTGVTLFPSCLTGTVFIQTYLPNR
jgi:hypothetical protein